MPDGKCILFFVPVTGTYLNFRMILKNLRSIYLCLIKYSIVIRIIVLLFVIISLSFCNSSTGKKHAKGQNQHLSIKIDSTTKPVSINNKGITGTYKNYSFRYDLNNPDERYVLPKYLHEISGLVYYKKGRLLCIQDEKANIYVVNLDNREVINKYNFGNDGDYEDIAIVDKTTFVIRSDGNIFEVENFDSENRIVNEHKTPLSAKNNTEGVTYDKTTNSLLIACKESTALEKENPLKGYTAIYRFDLKDMKLIREPAFLINLKRPDSFKDNVLFREISFRISQKNRLNNSDNRFHPSALAIHPLSDEIYLISNIRKMLIVLDRYGKISDYHDLDSSIFNQPEGICFSPEGDLFIANEGNSRAGYILKFKIDRDQ
jgi:uncharacterized protein YjiK